MSENPTTAKLSYLDGQQQVTAEGPAADVLETGLKKTLDTVVDNWDSIAPYVNTEGINLDRMADFMEGQGLRHCPMVFLDDAGYNALVDQVPKSERAIIPDRQFGKRGQYLSIFDLAVVYRSGDIEGEHGPETSEAAGIHEAAHGSGLNVTELELKDGAIITKHLRTGFATSELQPDGSFVNRGAFLDEAFADLVRGTYVHKALNRPHGFAPDLESVQALAGSEAWPTKYATSVDGEVRLIGTVPSIAAYGLELLLAHTPALAETLLQARRSVAALEEMYRVIDQISPGLVEHLENLTYTIEDFVKGANRIQAAVGDDIVKGYDQDYTAQLFGL